MSAVLGPVLFAPSVPVLPTEPIWRMSVERYHEMIEAGILTEDDPVELLEGWLVEKMPKNMPHRKAIRRLRLILERLAPVGWFVDAQEPITTTDSEPEPDLAVIRGDSEDYSNHPGPQDLALVVEVSDSTLQRDRITKQRIYARAGVSVYWIVNLIDGQVEVYTDPSGPDEKPSYRQRQDYGPADQVPFLIDGREIGRIAVREVLP
ncbi:MAG TPA: Uma2 family endonuclease [Planctomycetales bacterium]|nr:Uma2 family endonuclease [Planctomycetales bacterium]